VGGGGWGGVGGGGGGGGGGWGGGGVGGGGLNGGTGAWMEGWTDRQTRQIGQAAGKPAFSPA